MVRINLTVATLAVGVISASASSSASVYEPKGVAPSDLQKYQPLRHSDGQLRFQCLDGSKAIAWDALNDDYCDCPDGSDEPATSACPDFTFYCANYGHIPARIRSNRVNDGICDPECCDGTDETDGKVTCPNRCEKVGKEHRKKMAELDNLRKAGGKIRDKYIAEGKKEKEALVAEIAKLEVELQVASEREMRLKADLESAETVDKSVIDAKIKTPLYAKITAYQAAIKSLQDRNEKLKQELTTLTLLLDDLAKGYNPNYQDMAVKGAVVAYKDWRGTPSAESERATAESTDDAAQKDEPGSGDSQKLKHLFDQAEWPASKLDELLRENPLDVMDGGLTGAADTRVAAETDGGLLFRIHEYLPDSVVPYFEAMVDTLLDVLMKANIITDVKRMRPKGDQGGAEPENVAAARKAHSDAARHLSTTQSELEQLQNKLKGFGSKYGRQMEFKALENKCVSKNMGEYTYEYCFFGRANQIPNKGGAQISLGTFANWNPQQNKNESEDDYWMQQIYARGQRCWNGPERSAIIDLVCDTDNALLDVFEAEKCIYSIKLSTPAVCFPDENKAKNATSSNPAVKDEL